MKTSESDRYIQPGLLVLVCTPIALNCRVGYDQLDNSAAGYGARSRYYK